MKIQFQEGEVHVIKKTDQLSSRTTEPVNYSFTNAILNVHRNWLGVGNWAKPMPQILHDPDGWTWTFNSPNNANLYLTIEKNGEYLPRDTQGVWNNVNLGRYDANQYYALQFVGYEGDNAHLQLKFGAPFDYNNTSNVYYWVNYYLGYSGPLNESYETGVNKLLTQRSYGLVQSILDTSPFTSITGVWKPQFGGPIPYTMGTTYLLSMSGFVEADIYVSKEMVVPEPTDPYFEGGDTDVSVPTGDFDDSSDPIDFPSLPSLGATDTGLITLYNPSLAEVKALASYMWTNPAFDISAWKKIFADPIDAILGLSIVPVAVPDGGQRHIAVGNLFTDVVMNVAAQQYIELQCGALNVNEFWSSYLDYEPYTKAEIYLPYCGVHQLSVDDIMDKTIEVRYHIDILTGSCCAYVKCGDSVLYQFIGQCSSSIPVASGDFSEIISSALNAALAVGSLAATGGASAPFSVPEITANAVNILKEKIQKSGSLSGTGGMLAIQKPYLILTRPRQAHPANQNHYTGYPSFITENLSELSGYTEIEDIHLENVTATDSELNEIVSLLESGVIF